jgi:N,N'-diacetyllegionaminate synthase
MSVQDVGRGVLDASVIVEIGGNHEGDINYAFSLIDKAIQAGGKNIKLQSYTGLSLVNHKLDPSKVAHFDRFSIPYDGQVELAKYVIDNGANFMSSLWDESSFQMLNPFIKIHKVGSGDLNNYQMLSLFASTGKPLILSTAMADIKLISKSVDFLQTHFPTYKKPNQLAILHCVAMYGDLTDSYANLNAIYQLKESFPDLVIGYSDHTAGVVASIMALGKGAEITEVHFTDDKAREFRDHHLAVDENELSLLVEADRRVHSLNGSGKKEVVKEVETTDRIREFRRACYLNRNYEPGQTIQERDVVCLRPNEGLDASQVYNLIGKTAKVSIQGYSPLSWSFFDE